MYRPPQPLPYGQPLGNGAYGGGYVCLPFEVVVTADQERRFSYELPARIGWSLQLIRGLSKFTSASGMDVQRQGFKRTQSEAIEPGNASMPSRFLLGALTASLYRPAYYPTAPIIDPGSRFSVDFLDTSSSENTATGMFEGREIWNRPPPMAEELATYERGRALMPWGEISQSVAAAASDVFALQTGTSWGLAVQAIGIRASVAAADVRITRIQSNSADRAYHNRGENVAGFAQDQRLAGDVWGGLEADGLMNWLPVEIPVFRDQTLFIAFTNDNGSAQTVALTILGRILIPARAA